MIPGQKPARQQRPTGMTAPASPAVSPQPAQNQNTTTATSNKNDIIDAYKTQYGTPQAVAAAGGYANWLQGATGSQQFKDFQKNYTAPAANAGSGGTVASTSGFSNNNSSGTQYIAGMGAKRNAPASGLLSQAVTPEINPVTREVSSDELASNQLEKLLSKDSALSQRATTSGMQYANSRGLLNSGMAGEAAYGAWVDRASPFAVDDAGKYTNVLDKNMDTTNAFRMSDKTFGQDMAKQNDQQGWQSGESDLDRKLTSSENAANRSHESGLQGAEFSFRAGESAADRAQRLTELDRTQAFEGGQNTLDREQRLTELAQTQGFQAVQDEILRNFQADQNAIEREFQGEQGAAERQAREDELARASAQELMRQVSGMNASLVDAIAQIQSAELKRENKQAMIDNLIEMHYNNLGTTTAMADFDIVDGKVVYIEQGPATQQTPQNQAEQPYIPYLPTGQPVGNAIANVVNDMKGAEA